MKPTTTKEAKMSAMDHALSCALCGTITNHTTAMHQAMVDELERCVVCGEPKGHDDEEINKCYPCLADYWEWRRDQYYDNLIDEGGQG